MLLSLRTCEVVHMIKCGKFIFNHNLSVLTSLPRAAGYTVKADRPSQISKETFVSNNNARRQRTHVNNLAVRIQEYYSASPNAVNLTALAIQFLCVGQLMQVPQQPHTLKYPAPDLFSPDATQVLSDN